MIWLVFFFLPFVNPIFDYYLYVDNSASDSEGNPGGLFLGGYASGSEEDEDLKSPTSATIQIRPATPPVRQSASTSKEIVAAASPSPRALPRCRNPAPSKVRAMNLLPPSPGGVADSKVQERILTYLSKDESFNFSLQSMKSFHNPSILNKIATIYEINQNGSNYPEDLFNPQVLDLFFFLFSKLRALTLCF